MTIFSDLELQRLGELIGEDLLYITGADLNSNLLATKLFIETQSQKIQVEASSREEFFDGEYEEFSSMEISKGDSLALQQAKQTGNIYKKYSGEKITEIFVIQDEITGILDGKQNLHYVSDSGFILKLNNHFVTIIKADHNMPVIRVSYSESMYLSDIPQTESIFEEDVNQKYEIIRNIESISVRLTSN